MFSSLLSCDITLMKLSQITCSFTDVRKRMHAKEYHWACGKATGVDQPFFFEKAGNRLFGLYFPARNLQRATGFVFCNGFGDEFKTARTSISIFARQLASLGYPCLRFDYTGYGDSQGEFVDVGINSMCSDVKEAVVQLKQRSGVEKVGLIGLRFGATIATIVADQSKEIDRLVLWEPVINPWQYLMQELRATIPMQTTILRKVQFSRDQLVENVLAGVESKGQNLDFNVIAMGFPLGANLIREARDIDFAASPPHLRAPALVVHIQNRERPVPGQLLGFVEVLRKGGADISLVVAREKIEPWKHSDHWFATEFSELFGKTISWLGA
jgi:alpha/beta superfamily hydrolase